MAWMSFGMRDGLLLLVALAAIYLVVMLLRFAQVSRQRPIRHEVESTVEGGDPRPGRAEPELDSVLRNPSVPAAAPAPTFAWEDVKELFGEAPERKAAEVPIASPPTGFGEHLADHLARSDVEMEVQRMRDEMERMRVEMEELRAARRVSPQYAEAMELAQRGHSAQDVADRLGISLAEAELVQALSRGGKTFEEGDDHGADRHDTGATGGAGFDEFGR